MALMFDDLSDGLKNTLRGLRALHTEAELFSRVAAGSDAARAFTGVDLPQAIHPAVIAHPENGREVLYVNPGKVANFDGWTAAESAPLLGYLYQRALRPEYLCRFRWRAGSLAIWDNFQTWHYAVDDYAGQRRVMHRTIVVAEPFTAA